MELYHWQALAIVYGGTTLIYLTRIKTKRVMTWENISSSILAWLLLTSCTIGLVELYRRAFTWLE